MPTCQHDGLLHCLIGIQLDSQFVFACYLQAESYHTNCVSMMFHDQAAFCMPSLILMGSSSLGHKRLTLSQRRLTLPGKMLYNEEPWCGSRCVCTCHGSIEAHCHQQRDGGG